MVGSSLLAGVPVLDLDRVDFPNEPDSATGLRARPEPSFLEVEKLVLPANNPGNMVPQVCGGGGQTVGKPWRKGA
jgi:hypothetical protein